jgi:hypothetical protein
MTFEERAKLIWNKIQFDLDDRGCFNGIDRETMTELREAQIANIIAALGEQ